MYIAMTDFFHFRVSDHDEESDAIWDFPFVFIANFRFSLFGFYIDLEGKKCLFLSRLHILEEADAKLVAFSSMDRCLYDHGFFEGVLDPDPFRVFGIDDELPFDFVCHREFFILGEL